MNSFGEMSRSVSVVGETGFLPEMEVVVGQLERGTIITRFSSGKKSSKPEKMMLTIRRETMCVHWYKATSAAAQASGQHFQKWYSQLRPSALNRIFRVILPRKIRVMTQIETP